MATRSYIRVILKEEDRNRDMKFVPNEKQSADLSKNPWEGDDKDGCWETVNAGGKEALIIYHHWDGYIDGVGETLYNEYNNYEEALNLVLGGDVSTINGRYTSYATRKGEDWDSIQPKAVNEDHPCEEDYDYMFKDGEWFVRSRYDEECEDWTPLQKFMTDESKD